MSTEISSELLNGIAVVAALTAGTLITRFLPFLLFPAGKEQPWYISLLSRTLPYASMGLLVVYCLKNVNWLSAPFGFPEAAAVLVTAVLHHMKHNILLSIGCGTLCYMLLIQVVVPRLF